MFGTAVAVERDWRQVGDARRHHSVKGQGAVARPRHLQTSVTAGSGRIGAGQVSSDGDTRRGSRSKSLARAAAVLWGLGTLLEGDGC